jgi:hypothetical protein
MNNNLEFWLIEQDTPLSRMQMPSEKPEEPAQPQTDIPDITADPQIPDRPEENGHVNFPSWKLDFLEQAIKADANTMMDSINQIRDLPLEAPDRKFVEDNINILFLRQDANIDKASDEIRKLIKQELDRANPGTTVMQHIVNTLEAFPQLNIVFIKLCGLYALKGDAHRKFMAALTGSVQVGGGGEREDLIYSEKDYSINFSTRFYTDFGSISIGDWSPQEDDPNKYLSQPEVERLEEGSPEERQVLRNRVVLESIAEKFHNRAFLIHVVEPVTGTIHSIGWDIAESLREGYKQGKFVVRPKRGIEKDAMFTMDGHLIPLNELSIFYVKQNDGDIQGVVSKQEVPFMERKDGKLHLNGTLDVLEEVSNAVSGFYLKDTPYTGNPSDLNTLMRCVPSMTEIILRRC